MFGCEHGTAASRTSLQRLEDDRARHSSRDEDGPIGWKNQPTFSDIEVTGDSEKSRNRLVGDDRSENFGKYNENTITNSLCRAQCWFYHASFYPNDSQRPRGNL